MFFRKKPRRKRATKKATRKHSGILSVLKGAFFLACIALSIGTSIFLFAHTIPTLGIILASVLSAFFAVPLTTSMIPYFRNTRDALESQKDKELFLQQREIERLTQQNEQLESREQLYEQRLTLLKNLTFNMETYKDVFKICFRDYQQTSTIKNREKFNEAEFTNSLKKLLGKESKNYDEILSVMDCFISYQRGVDLQNIRIAKINDDTIVVSGIKPEYTSRPRFEYKEFFSEYRHVKLDKNGQTRHITVETDGHSARELATRQNEYKAFFEDSFLDGTEQDADAEEIIKRAKDFIQIILSPIYRHVEFDDAHLAQDSVPLLDYLHAETRLYQKRLADSTAHNAGHTGGSPAEPGPQDAPLAEPNHGQHEPDGTPAAEPKAQPATDAEAQDGTA